MPESSVLIAAAVAALLLLVLVVPRLQGLRRPPADVPVPAYRPRSEEDELRELGIIGVRPRDPSAPRPAALDAASAPAPTSAPAPVVPRAPATVEDSTRPPTRARRTRRDEDWAPEEAARAAQEHLLNALLLSTGAHTVCLLRHDDGPPARYHVVRIVSRNAYARPDGHFAARTPLLTPGPKRRTTLHRVGHGSAFPADALGYYREPMDALREALATPVALDGVAHVLVADAMHDGRLGDRRARTLIEATARMLENAPPVAVAPAAPAHAPDADAPDADAHAVAPADAGQGTPPSAPSALVAEALATAGAAGLAVVLVHVEPLGSDDDRLEGDALAAAEATLHAHLVPDLPDGARLDRFGDLTFAVFVPDTSDALDQWADDTYARLAAAYPDGRAALGGVVHDGLAPLTADDLRQHALHALAASYDERAPVLLG